MKRGVSQDMSLYYSTANSVIEKFERVREASAEALLQRAKKMIAFLKDQFQELRTFITHYEFDSNSEEIRFFKEQCPSLLHYLIYYTKKYNLELSISVLHDASIKKYLRAEKKSIVRWKQKNESFFRYCKSGASELDDKYFLKNSQPTILIADPGHWLFDSSFITLPSYLLAELLANERYLNDLEQKLTFYQPSRGAESAGKPDSQVVWTAPNIAAVEFLYGFYFAGFCNRGAAQLKQIAQAFEKAFNINLGNFYRYGMDLKIKKNRTQYTQMMKDAAEKGWDEMDLKPSG